MPTGSGSEIELQRALYVKGDQFIGVTRMTDRAASGQTPPPTAPAKPKDSSSRQQRHADQSKDKPKSEEGRGNAGTSPTTLVPPNAK